MTFHARENFHLGAVLHARQGGRRPRTTRSTQRTTSTSSDEEPTSTESSTESSTTTSETSTSTSSTSTSTSETSTTLTSTSSRSAVHTITSTSTIFSSSARNGGISTRSPTLSTPSASSSGDTAAISTGPIVGGVIGTFAAIVIVATLLVFIVKRATKRRELLDEAGLFDKEKLERPAMVHDNAAGPGVGTPNMTDNEKASHSFSIIERLKPNPHSYSEIPPAPFAPMQQPTSAYGNVNPFSPVSYGASSYEQHQDMGAPPIPGVNVPASYATYGSPTGAGRAPPGAPFAEGHATSNPFASPAVSRHGSSSSVHPEQPSTPSSHFPLPPGIGTFGTDAMRSSGYSAVEAHVGQAFKVRLGANMPKYEDLKRESAGNVLSRSPTCTVTPPDADTSASVVMDIKDRRVSAATIYNPEDAYGGM